MTKSKTTFLRTGILAAFALLGATVPSTGAFAATSPVTDVITNVQYSNGASGLILTTGSNGFFQALLTSPSCTPTVPATTPDTMKTWTSLAQAAVLSGKTVQITFTNCSNGGIYITTMSLNR